MGRDILGGGLMGSKMGLEYFMWMVLKGLDAGRKGVKYFGLIR
jgi:hypothetical protein